MAKISNVYKLELLIEDAQSDLYTIDELEQEVRRVIGDELMCKIFQFTIGKVEPLKIKERL